MLDKKVKSHHFDSVLWENKSLFGSSRKRGRKETNTDRIENTE